MHNITNYAIQVNNSKSTIIRESHMHSLKYTVIKDKKQYVEYCDRLEKIVLNDDGGTQDEIELLTVLIEKWDKENSEMSDKDPIVLLKALMAEHHLKAKDLADIVGLSKGTISKILNYYTGLSKQTIRKLSEYFRVSHEAFNRPYPLKHGQKRNIQNRQPDRLPVGSPGSKN